MMYGKHFASMYAGSMVGSGALTFALMGYVISMMKPDKDLGAVVELNPKLIGAILGEEEKAVESKIHEFTEPDEKSRSKQNEGRKLIRLGQFEYQVVNGAKYMAIRNEEERREQNRINKNAERQRKKMGKTSTLQKSDSPSSNPSLEVELPHGFPKTEQEAIAMAGHCGADSVFISTLWNSAMAQGGIAGNGRSISSWVHYVAKHWPGEQVKRAQAKASGKPDPTKTIEDVVREDTAREIKMTLRKIERMEDESRL